MSVIYILIPIAIIFTSVAIYLFFWAVKTEQFDDLEKQGMSILFDDEPKAQKTSNNKDISNSNGKTSDNPKSDAVAKLDTQEDKQDH